MSAEAHAASLAPAGEPRDLRRLALDLDGDGADELGLGIESICGAHLGNCEFHLYRLGEGACAHYLGAIEGEPRLGASQHHGLRDLVTSWSMGGGSWTESRYVFDGEQYRGVATRSCRQGDGEDPVCDGEEIE